MSIVSVHIADVGLPKALGLIRHPKPGSIPGLIHANAGVAAKFGTTPARVSPGRVGLIAFWEDEAALTRFESGHRLAASLSGGLAGPEEGNAARDLRPCQGEHEHRALVCDVPLRRDVTVDAGPRAVDPQRSRVHDDSAVQRGGEGVRRLEPLEGALVVPERDEADASW